jgi:hypothetical protein
MDDDTNEDEFEEPLTHLAQGAVQLHEMYTAYMAAGFPERRAFKLTLFALDRILAASSDDD